MGARVSITLRVDAVLLKEARALAAREGTSVSKYLAEALETRIRERRRFDGAKRRALSHLEAGRKLNWTSPRSREELHER